jgi:hypothetical protein
MSDNKTTAYNAHDMRDLNKIVERCEGFIASVQESGHPIDGFELTVYDSTGSYVIGTIFWDPEGEHLKIDLALYGRE